MTRTPAAIFVDATILLGASVGLFLGGSWLTTILEPGSSLLEITGVLSGGLALSMLVFGAFAVYQANAAARDARLRILLRNPVLMSSMRTAGMTRTLRTMSRLFRNGAERLTYGFTVAGDDRGISFWAGSSRKPLLIWELTWDRVLDISVTQVAQATRSTRGISLRVLDDERTEQVIGLVAVGAGVGGLFAVRRGVLDSLQAEFAARRSAYADATQHDAAESTES